MKKRIRPKTYNQGVADARAAFARKLRHLRKAYEAYAEDSALLSDLLRYLSKAAQRANARPGGAGRR